MAKKNMPWIQDEQGLTLLLARDENFLGPFQGINDLMAQNELRVVTTTQKFPLGSMIYDVGNDAVHRYVEFGGTTKSGDFVAAEGPDAAHDVLDPTGAAAGAGVAKGSTIISFTDSLTLVANEYANGYLSVLKDTGIGYSYPIKSNGGVSAAVNGFVTLYEPGLALAIDSTSDVALTKSRFQEIIIAPTAPTAQPVGVGLGVGADGSFGWVTTRGPACVRMITILPTIGDDLIVSPTTAGGVELVQMTDGTPPTLPLGPIVGRTILPAANTTEAGMMFVTIE